jgi:5-methylcytosine-specific restriction protein A
VTPTASLKRCPIPTCQQLVAHGRCAEHARKPRPSAESRGYGGAWRTARAHFLAEHPRCIDCNAAATEVDHVVPHRGDPALVWSRADHVAVLAQPYDRDAARRDGQPHPLPPGGPATRRASARRTVASRIPAVAAWARGG